MTPAIIYIHHAKHAHLYDCLIDQDNNKFKVLGEHYFFLFAHY